MKRHNTMTKRSAMVHLIAAAVLIVVGSAGCSSSGHDTATEVNNRVLWDKDGKAYHASDDGFARIILRRAADLDGQRP